MSDLRLLIAQQIDPKLFDNYGGRGSYITPLSEARRKKNALSKADKIIALMLLHGWLTRPNHYADAASSHR